MESKTAREWPAWLDVSLVAGKVTMGMLVLVGGLLLVVGLFFFNSYRVRSDITDLSIRALPQISKSAELGAALQITLSDVGRLGAAETHAERRLALGEIKRRMALTRDLSREFQSMNPGGDTLPRVMATMDQSIARLDSLIEQRIDAAIALERAVARLTQYNSVRRLQLFTDSTEPGYASLSQWDAAINLIVARSLESAAMTRVREIRDAEREVVGLLGGLQRYHADQRSYVRREMVAAEAQLTKLVSGEDGIFPILRASRTSAARARSVENQTSTLTEEAGKLAISIFDSTNQQAAQKAEDFSVLLAAQTKYMIAAGLAVLLAVGGVYHYFRRSIAGRLVRLNDEVLGHVEGRGTKVIVAGSDEIADIARSINYFMGEIEKQQSELHEAIAAAENASASKSKFLANVSHDVRTPLTGIMAAIELLFQSRLTKSQAFLLSRAKLSGKILQALIDDLLDMARLESGRLSLNPSNFTFRELVEGVVVLLETTARDKGLDLVTEIDPDLPEAVHADFNRLTQILVNLVGNALKFTSEGFVRLAVRKQGLGRRARFEFVVSDSGVGIPTSRQKILFERFEQIGERAKDDGGGLGLGLSICRDLVELMNGTISVESEQGKGTTFTVQLPYKAPKASARDSEVEAKPVVTPVRGAPRKILVAEDNEINQRLIRMILESIGHKVEIVKNGEEALSQLNGGNFDLVLMDIQMPVMDGKVATRKIRALDGPLGSVPIIALTAHAMETEAEHLIEIGINAIVTKPIDTELLGSTIEEVVA